MDQIKSYIMILFFCFLEISTPSFVSSMEAPDEDEATDSIHNYEVRRCITSARETLEDLRRNQDPSCGVETHKSRAEVILEKVRDSLEAEDLQHISKDDLFTGVVCGSLWGIEVSAPIAQHLMTFGYPIFSKSRNNQLNVHHIRDLSEISTQNDEIFIAIVLERENAPPVAFPPVINKPLVMDKSLVDKAILEHLSQSVCFDELKKFFEIITRVVRCLRTIDSRFISQVPLIAPHYRNHVEQWAAVYNAATRTQPDVRSAFVLYELLKNLAEVKKNDATRTQTEGIDRKLFDRVRKAAQDAHYCIAFMISLLQPYADAYLLFHECPSEGVKEKNITSDKQENSKNQSKQRKKRKRKGRASSAHPVVDSFSPDLPIASTLIAPTVALLLNNFQKELASFPVQTNNQEEDLEEDFGGTQEESKNK